MHREALTRACSFVLGAAVVLMAGAGCKKGGSRKAEDPAKISQRRVKAVLAAADRWQQQQQPDEHGIKPCPTVHLLVPRYLKKRDVRDGWGSLIEVKCGGPLICVHSLGRNGIDQQGKGDDIRRCNTDGISFESAE